MFKKKEFTIFQRILLFITGLVITAYGMITLHNLYNDYTGN